MFESPEDILFKQDIKFEIKKAPGKEPCEINKPD
jgi:hypothetical protein